MSLSWTFASLSAAIKQHIDGDTSSTTTGLGATGAVETIIKSAEERILKELPVNIFDTEATITLSSGNPLVTKPDGYVAWRYANFTDTLSNKVPLDLRTLEYIEDYNPNPATTGTPKFLADYSETQWKAAPTPNASLSGKAMFVKRPVSLVVNTSGTWLSQNAGLLLFRACLMCAEELVQEDERITVWKTDYSEALASAARELQAMIRPSYSDLRAMPTPK